MFGDADNRWAKARRRGATIPRLKSRAIEQTQAAIAIPTGGIESRRGDSCKQFIAQNNSASKKVLADKGGIAVREVDYIFNVRKECLFLQRRVT
jgi:hypothetical protein